MTDLSSLIGDLKENYDVEYWGSLLDDYDQRLSELHKKIDGAKYTEWGLVALKANTLMTVSNIQVPSRPRGVTVTAAGDVYVALQFGAGLRIPTDANTGKLQNFEKLALRKNNPADLALHKNIKGDKQVPTRSFAVVPNPNNKEFYFAHIEANPGSQEQTLSQLLGTEQETEEKCETKCTQTCKKECSQSCKQVCATSTTCQCSPRAGSIRGRSRTGSRPTRVPSTMAAAKGGPPRRR